MLFDTLSKPYKGEVAEGAYKVTLIKASYTVNGVQEPVALDPEMIDRALAVRPKNGNPLYDFTTLTFQLPDREFSKNFFEKDVLIFMSHVRRQMGIETSTIQPIEFINGLITSKQEIGLWIDYPTVITRQGFQERRQNIHFLPPRTKASEENDTEVEKMLGELETVGTPT